MVDLVRQNLKNNKHEYNKVKKILKKQLPSDVPINHVGSTAIPNMYGKNIIDILIGAKDLSQFENISKVLENNNFIGSQKSKDDIYQFFASTEKETSSGDIHIHLVITNTERYNDFIILRNYLLNNKQEAQAYSNFKKNLIKNGVIDRKEYKALKSKYVDELLIRARKG